MKVIDKIFVAGLCSCMQVCWFVSLCTGDESPEEMYFLEIPSVVTASKLEQSINDAPSVVTVITKEEIRKFGGNNLHDILNRAASVYTIGNQYLNVDGNTSIRGDLIFGQDLHTLILLNGRPLRDGIGGYALGVYEGFPLDEIERIEVVRGPGSVLYGSNAYAGVINIITHRQVRTGMHASIGGGSFGTAFGSVDGGVIAGDLVVTGAMKYFGSTGWNFTATDIAGVTKTREYGKNNVGIDATIEYKALSVNIYGASIRDACMANRPLWNTDNTFSDVGDDWLFVDAGYTQELSSAWRMQYNIAYTRTYFYFTNIPQNKHKSLNYLAEATLFGKFSSALNVLVGSVIEKRVQPDTGDVFTTINNVDYYENPIKTIDQNNFSSYAQFNYSPLKSLLTTAGIQYNQPYRGYPGIVPRLGVIVSITKNLGAKLLYGQAFRSPSMTEQYLNAASTLRGNPDLQPEIITTTDVQVYYNNKRCQATATVFSSKYNNLIARDTSRIPTSFMNYGGVQVQGVELEGKVSLLYSANVQGSYTYQKNKSDSGIEDYMPIAAHMVKLGVIYDMNSKISFGLFDQYYSKPPDIAAINPARLSVNPTPEAYHFVTLNMLYKVSDRVDVNIYGTNLADQSIAYPEFGTKSLNSLPGQPGAAVYLKLSVSL